MNNQSLDMSLFFSNRDQVLSNHWIKKVDELNQTIFGNNSGENFVITRIIEDYKKIFYQMSNHVNESNRRKFCKVLFNYCEISQDYRDWGNWIQEEIAKGVDKDSPWLYCALGRYLEEKGQFLESFKYHKNGILASIEFHDQEFLAFNHLGAGITLQRSQKPQEAEWHLQQALDLFRRQNNLYQQANTLANLGSCYDRFNQGQKAISSYLESASILRSIGNIFDLGRILYSLGIAYLNVGNLHEAELTFIEGKENAEKTGNLYFLSLIYYGLGWLKYKKCNFAESRNLLEIAITQLTETKKLTTVTIQATYPESEGNIYLLAGAVAIKVTPPDFSAAHTYINQAEYFYQQIDFNQKKLAKVLANRARIYEYSKDWNHAIHAFLQLLKTGKKIKSMNTAADAAVHLVRIHRKKSTSLVEWLVLIKNLGYYGIIALLKVLFQEKQRLFSR